MWSKVATLPLVPAVVDAVAPVPVIAAGGIGDARGVAAVFALGAQAAWLGTRFLLAKEMPTHEEYRRRLIDAVETDAQWYPDLYDVGWPDAPHRALRNSTSEMWEAAGRPPLGSRPGEGDVLAHFASGEAIVRYEPERRWRVPPATSKRSHCGPDRALRSPGSKNQLPRSCPSSFPACNPGRPPPASMTVLVKRFRGNVSPLPASDSLSCRFRLARLRDRTPYRSTEMRNAATPSRDG